jgi:hypothetical protein
VLLLKCAAAEPAVVHAAEIGSLTSEPHLLRRVFGGVTAITVSRSVLAARVRWFKVG